MSFAYGGGDDILSDVDLQLTAGWYGLVGANGSGKTTLVRLLAGELAPTAGHVARAPADATLVACAQDVDAPTADVQALGSAWDRTSLRWQARLSLDPDQLERWPTLSPGERRRWQIAAALAAAPDILLLDEPTNHVDVDTRHLLAAALRRFGGIGVVVSHDRAFLDDLVDHTLRIEAGTVAVYSGNHTAAAAQWTAERNHRRQLAARARDIARREDRALARARDQRARSAHALSSSARMKGPRDSDARSSATKGRVRRAEANLGRAVTVARERAHRAAAEAADIGGDRERGGDLFVGYVAAPARWLCRFEREPLWAGDHRLADALSLSLGREARVRIVGANGAGKTTLLRAIADRIAPGRRFHLPQELTTTQRRRVAAEVNHLPRAERGQVLAIADALGLDPTRPLASGEPSPGEARKLALAMALRRQVWALLLDEPSNHLDMASIERLEAALAWFPGAIVLVSHDQRLAHALTELEWRLDGSRHLELPSITP